MLYKPHMFLESSVSIIDPKNRNLDLSDIIGNNYYWQIDSQSGLQYLSINQPWVSLQGPYGILIKLNRLGLINKTTGKPFHILSSEEYRNQLSQSVCTIL